MFFNLAEEMDRQSYLKNYKSYKQMTELLEDTKNIKNQLKNYLKKNKYMKYADNGEDFIYLFPNSKFFKKFKDEEEQEDAVKETVEMFLIEELEFEMLENSRVVEFLDIEITKNKEDKPIIYISWMV